MDSFPLDELVEKAGSRYAVVVAAAERARQIKDGSPPLVVVTSRNPLTIALAEIAQGKVIITEPEEVPPEPAVSREHYYVGTDETADENLPYRRSVDAEESAPPEEADEEADEEAEDATDEDTA